MVVAIDRRVDLETFGIGDGLREARLGRGLELADVERETCIRAANLEAIESERFDALPGDVYAAGFIRTYAEHLGLDGALYAERFRQSREVEPEPVAPAFARYRRRQLLAAAIALLAGGLVAFVLLRGGDATAPRTPAVSKPSPPLRLEGPLTIRSIGGPTWVAVRFGGPHGPLVRQGTLRRGRMLRFGLDRPLWVGLGRPENASVRIGTKRVRIVPARDRFVFSSRGVRRG
jgi:hypothetical protein